jgi:4-amino-4-deoxy-L-arabinose transferase-like glycosyltransferase
MSKKKPTPIASNTARAAVNVTNSESTPSKPISPWVYAAIAAIFVAITIMARMNLASIPFERDEGSYSLMGQMLLEGKKPYTYFYEMKLPGLFYCYAAIAAIFGKTIEGMHYGFMMVVLISTVCIFLIGKMLFDARAGAVAAIAFSLLTLNKYASGFTAQAEHLVVMWALLGIYSILCAMKSGKWFEYLAAGIFLGMSFLVKQSGALFALSAGMFMLVSYLKPLNIKEMLINGTILVSGFVAISGAFLLSVYVQGGWSEMMFWLIDIPNAYAAGIPFDMGMKLLKGSMNSITQEYMGLWYLAGFGAILLWFTSADLYKKVGVNLLLVLAFATVSPGMRFYGHYFIQLMPAIALLIAAFVYAIGDISEHKFNLKIGGTIGFALFLLVCVSTISGQKGYYFAPNQFEILRQVYGDNPFVESKPVADKIKSLAKAGDQLMVWGSEPQLSFYTQLPSPTRHTFIAVTNVQMEKTKAWKEEIKKDVEAAKPTFMVMVNHPFSWQFKTTEDQDMYRWAYEYANKNYDLVGFADIIPNSRPAYVWDAAAVTYKPKGEKYMVVFKRKIGQ